MINIVNQLKMIKFKVFLRLLILSLGLGAVILSGASGQVISTYDSTLISVSQSPIPPNDSGGRWVPMYILLTSYSALPVRVYQFEPIYFSASAVFQDFRFDDSAFFRADSIFPAWYWGGSIGYDKPWERMDSIKKWGMWSGWSFSFLLPPYGTIRVPFWSKLIGESPQPDTARSGNLVLDVFSDSIVGSTTYHRIWYTGLAWVKNLAPCAAPYLIHFDDLPLNNSQNPVVLGQWPPWQYQRHIGQPDDTIYDPTTASYQIVGEYADRFEPPAGMTIAYSGELSFIFNGAPKSIVYDTLISTLTDCWGTVVTRTPIEGYTVVDMRNCYSLPGGGGVLTAPFFGSAMDTTTIINTSTFPIELTNLQLTNYNKENNFQIVSAPNVIAAHDSGTIIVRFLDNDKRQDAIDPRFSATLTGVISPALQEVSFMDSAFSFDLAGTIDVYCPYSSQYAYAIPLIKHGIHPTGIVFYSGNILTTFSTAKSFLTIYGNNDSVSEYFYTPYYDDSLFKITVHDYNGIGSVTLPGLISPDTAFFSPNTEFIQTLTEFAGDDYHNYRTQLHWPRSNDTVTMDVLALGSSAPPFDGVAMKTLSSGFSMWPNPASSTLHVSSAEPGATIAIYDLLGRELVSAELLPNTSLDISNLTQGIYSVVLNSKDEPTVVEELTVVR